MDVSIIIVNYNTCLLTANCINSIFEYTEGITFEVILVDNASSDGSVEMFSSDSRIKFIEAGDNLGFGKANNLGYKYSQGKYVFLLNSDTLLKNNAIKIFKEKMDNLPRTIACLGTILLNEQLMPTHSYYVFPKWYHVVFPFTKTFKERNNITERVVDQLIGADLFIRRYVIEEVGFFDPGFFMYFEETDLQERFFQHGYSSYLITSPQIIHLEGKSSTVSRWKEEVILASCIYYFKKRMPYPVFLLWKSIVVLKRKVNVFWKYKVKRIL